MEYRCKFIIHEENIEKIRGHKCNEAPSSPAAMISCKSKTESKQIKKQDSLPQPISTFSDQSLNIQTSYIHQLGKLQLQGLLCLLSLLIQGAMFYGALPDNDLTLNSISIVTLLIVVVQLGYALVLIKHPKRLSLCIRLAAYSLHPNIFTYDHNSYLHLIMICRILVLIEYVLKYITYYQPRSARVLVIYGEPLERRLQFTIKCFLNNLSVVHILILYALLIVFYSHCIVIASSCSNKQMHFSEALELMTTTFTTVGYGQIRGLDSWPERLVVYLTVCCGIMSNSFITMSSLNKLMMSDNQKNSYRISKLLDIRVMIERTSARFLLQTIVHKIRDKFLMRQKYKKFKGEIQNHKNYIRQIARKGMMEFYTCTFRRQMESILRKQNILNSLINTVVATLKKQPQSK